MRKNLSSTEKNVFRNNNLNNTKFEHTENKYKSPFSNQEKKFNLDIVKCKFCNLEIKYLDYSLNFKRFSGSYILANDRTWCPDHFICANSACGRRLLDCGFMEADKGKNYCEKCYETLIAPNCAKCGLSITSVRLIFKIIQRIF